jgi:uncharacterized protein with PQ loop repeat
MEFIGWLGSILFCLCGLPQAIKSYKEGHSRGLSNAFLWLWFLGEILSFIYVLPKLIWPLIGNYIVNFIFLLVIMKFKYFERIN